MKKLNHILLRGTACLALLAAAAGCEIEEGHQSPRATTAERSIYDVFEGRIAETMQLVFFCYGIDEWVRQTDEAGREFVRRRFFPYGTIQIVEDGYWLTYGERTYKIVVKDGLPLRSEGASWHLAYIDHAGWTGEAILSAEGDGLSMSFADRKEHISSEVSWTLRVELTELDFRVTAEGEVKSVLKAYDEDNWTIRSRTLAPMTWREKGFGCDGRFAIEAELEGAEHRLIAFEAEAKSGSLTITRGDVKETW